jgi:hypothetical protein
MLRTLAAAVVAVSLIGGPVLAQGTSTAPATTSQPAAKADTAKTGVKANKTVAHMSKTRKHVAHVVKRHVKHAKRGTHVKQVKQPVKSNTAG